MKNLVNKYGKKKVYGTASVLVVLIVAIICGTVYFMNQDKDKLIIKSETITMELGEEVKLKPSNFLSDEMEKQDVNATVLKTDLMTDKEKYTFDEKKLTVISKDKKYLEVGKYEINLRLNDEKAKVTLEVKDTTKPTFKDLKKEIKVEQNAKDVDFTKYFKVEDLSKVTVKVDAKKVDLSKTGEYALTVTATDEYKNKAKVEVKVIVVSLEEAEKGNVSEMTDGTKPQSEALTQKQEEQKHEETNNTGSNTSNGNTGNVGSNGNTGGNNGGTSQQPQKPAQPIYRTDISNRIVAQINAYRNQLGLVSISTSSYAQQVADKRAKELVDNYSHSGAIERENIGHGPIGSDFFTAWKNSPAHNSNMIAGNLLDANLQDTGIPAWSSIAVSVVEYNGEWYAVTVFIPN